MSSAIKTLEAKIEEWKTIVADEDWSGAHEMEDNIMWQVLVAISEAPDDATVEEMRELAALATTMNKLHHTRWFS